MTTVSLVLGSGGARGYALTPLAAIPLVPARDKHSP